MFKLLKTIDKKLKLLMIFILLLIISQVWLDLKIPDYMSSITKLVQTKGTTNDILNQGFYMLSCAFLSLICAVIIGFLSSFVSTNFSKDLRRKVFKKVEDFSYEEIKEFSTSSLITRTTNDITQVQTFVTIGLQLILKAPIMAIWAILKIYNKGFEWSIITACAVIILIIMITILIIFALPKFKIIQRLTDNINKIARENLTGIRVVRAFNAFDYQQNKFNEANKNLTKTNLFTQRLMGIMSPVMMMIMSGLSLAIYTVGAYLINKASLMDKIDIFSNMVVFSSYAVQVVMSFMMLIMIFIFFPRASVSAKRILEVLEKETKIKYGTFNKKTKEIGTIEFKNVSFKYPDAVDYTLENISFKVNKGETVAFIGSTGSGKSTLINLIPRFYDATEGEILIDGVNIKDYTNEALNNKLGYISQKPVIFSGTVKSNVSYGKKDGKKVSLESIKKALDISQASEFVLNLDNTYDAHIAQLGTNISGGQKQRLAIARAIARNPEIYIFDDSFSALDYKTDYTLRKKLKEYTETATVLIVAQRIGTIKNADKIIVLNDGKMVGMGRHEQLLKDCEVYKEIALSQLSKEELTDASSC